MMLQHLSPNKTNHLSCILSFNSVTITWHQHATQMFKTLLKLYLNTDAKTSTQKVF